MPAREKRAGYTWLSVHMSDEMKEAISRLARHEDRSISAMARRLMAEALRARGVRWSEEGESEGD
jgi:predicted transcriptional regulator